MATLVSRSLAVSDVGVCDDTKRHQTCSPSEAGGKQPSTRSGGHQAGMSTRRSRVPGDDERPPASGSELPVSQDYSWSRSLSERVRGIKDNALSRVWKKRRQRKLQEIELMRLCRWLETAGFPQYVQLYKDDECPIEISAVERDHTFLDDISLQSLVRRIELLNRMSLMKINISNLQQSGDSSSQEDHHSDDFTYYDHVTLSDQWTFDVSTRRWVHKEESGVQRINKRGRDRQESPAVQGSMIVNIRGGGVGAVLGGRLQSNSSGDSVLADTPPPSPRLQTTDEIDDEDNRPFSRGRARQCQRLQPPSLSSSSPSPSHSSTASSNRRRRGASWSQPPTPSTSSSCLSKADPSPSSLAPAAAQQQQQQDRASSPSRRPGVVASPRLNAFRTRTRSLLDRVEDFALRRKRSKNRRSLHIRHTNTDPPTCEKRPGTSGPLSTAPAAADNISACPSSSEPIGPVSGHVGTGHMKPDCHSLTVTASTTSTTPVGRTVVPRFIRTSSLNIVTTGATTDDDDDVIESSLQSELLPVSSSKKYNRTTRTSGGYILNSGSMTEEEKNLQLERLGRRPEEERLKVSEDDDGGDVKCGRVCPRIVFHRCSVISSASVVNDSPSNECEASECVSSVGECRGDCRVEKEGHYQNAGDTDEDVFDLEQETEHDLPLTSRYHPAGIGRDGDCRSNEEESLQYGLAVWACTSRPQSIGANQPRDGQVIDVCCASVVNCVERGEPGACSSNHRDSVYDNIQQHEKAAACSMVEDHVTAALDAEKNPNVLSSQKAGCQVIDQEQHQLVVKQQDRSAESKLISDWSSDDVTNKPDNLSGQKELDRILEDIYKDIHALSQTLNDVDAAPRTEPYSSGSTSVLKPKSQLQSHHNNLPQPISLSQQTVSQSDSPPPPPHTIHQAFSQTDVDGYIDPLDIELVWLPNTNSFNCGRYSSSKINDLQELTEVVAANQIDSFRSPLQEPAIDSAGYNLHAASKRDLSYSSQDTGHDMKDLTERPIDEMFAGRVAEDVTSEVFDTVDWVVGGSESPRVSRERRDSGVGSSLTRTASGSVGTDKTRLVTNRRLTISAMSSEACDIDSHFRSPGVALTCLTAPQLNILCRLALVKLTAILERFTPQHLMDVEHGALYVICPATEVRHKTDSLASNEVTAQSKSIIFGASLLSIAQRTGRALPQCIMGAMQYLESCGNSDSVGIFRKSGVHSRIQKLKHLMDLNPEFEDFSSHQVYDVADMLKLYFRELPDCLLTSRLSQSFVHIFAYVPVELRLECLRLIVFLLPDENRDVLHSLLLFLCHMSTHSQHTEMSASNIAICFAPSLMRVGTSRDVTWSPLTSQATPPPSPNSKQKKEKKLQQQLSTASCLQPDPRDVQEQRLAHECLTCMITNVQSLFIIPEDLYIQCSQLSKKSYHSYLHPASSTPPFDLERVEEGPRDDVKQAAIGQNEDVWKAMIGRRAAELFDSLHKIKKAEEDEEEEKGSIKRWNQVESYVDGVSLFYNISSTFPLGRWRCTTDIHCSQPKDVLRRITDDRHAWDVDTSSWTVEGMNDLLSLPVVSNSSHCAQTTAARTHHTTNSSTLCLGADLCRYSVSYGPPPPLATRHFCEIRMWCTDLKSDTCTMICTAINSPPTSSSPPIFHSPSSDIPLHADHSNTSTTEKYKTASPSIQHQQSSHSQTKLVLDQPNSTNGENQIESVSCNSENCQTKRITSSFSNVQATSSSMNSSNSQTNSLLKSSFCASEGSDPPFSSIVDAASSVPKAPEDGVRHAKVDVYVPEATAQFLIRRCSSQASHTTVTMTCHADIRGYTPRWYTNVYSRICCQLLAKIRDSFNPVTWT